MIQQFDDAEEPSQTSEETRSGGMGPMWSSNEKWQEEWFSHEDRKYDAEEDDEVIMVTRPPTTELQPRCFFAHDLPKKLAIVTSHTNRSCVAR